MKSILLLTDFSDNAFLAAEYACMLAKKWKTEHLLIFYADQANTALESMPTVAAGREELRNETIHTLEVWQDSLRQLAGPGIEVSFLMEDTILESRINRICEEKMIDLVVMGITGRTGMEKLLIGSNAIRVMGNIRYPLLIVPSETVVEYPHKVVLATDLKDVREKMDTPLLLKVLDTLGSDLLVVNVSQAEGDVTGLRDQIGDTHSLLDKYHATYHYISDPDIVTGINDFTSEKEAGLIIALHRHQNGLAAIFRKSVSKRLAWHSSIPVMVLPVS
ncbi:universal stress protein [Pseudobacter ginsenosidimutans]|uniref:Nucleotide-binding universal stress UspA family protein n=1 Tax=Pseudobacter ginsenosidimutans TaxID=661488 RepID=A0A4Q7MFY5_9BACT|nr:universal stress protein [Pseudobacter ginsenosidimutans]QEC45555.1 hypothetical protein FSB84_29120 [Pseudobacter ginsenosidimutans]RZS67096.1 nucleotide-binding universal stress UspA family protein [Pseudobacter ginsenosidimutans]